MANKRINTKPATLFFWLFWLLLSVPLTAAAGWQDKTAQHVSKQARQTGATLPELIYHSSEHFSEINSANLDGLLSRIGDSRLVLLGEASHGTAEFYDMRARITRELIEKKGFNIIAVEADWPDAASIDRFIRGSGDNPFYHTTFKNGLSSNIWFSGFPSWMWANHSVLAFVHWLKDYNRSLNSAEDTVGFYGLDLYNMYSSIDAVLDYLQNVDPTAAEVARRSYACLMPWANDPSLYSRDMVSGRYPGCEYEVFAVLQDLRKKRALYRQAYRPADRKAVEQQFFNAEQNARMVRNGERYYRTLYAANNNSWNQRDQNMFETLQAILNYRGQISKAVVWAHNSHIGDARATSMIKHGEINLGQRVRETFADSAYLIGFGTNHGSVAAASEWGGAMKVMQVRPSHKDSYERLFHHVKADNFLLPLRNTIMRNPVQATTRKNLLVERLQRAIGTTYDPEDELKKHYSYASLPRQFDEYIWFDETRAVKPLNRETLRGVPDTFPFGL
jgi:protein-L-isoaspartate(D-aspartate) O-methyltransferase